MSDEIEDKTKVSKSNNEDDYFDNMDAEEAIDDTQEKEDSDNESDSSSAHSHSSDGRRRRHSRTKKRIKVKKRIRVKKKTSGKRKYKKFFETIIWIVLIAGFLTAIVVLFNTLELNDAKYKGGKRTMNERGIQQNRIDKNQLYTKQKSSSIVNSI